MDDESPDLPDLLRFGLIGIVVFVVSLGAFLGSNASFRSYLVVIGLVVVVLSPFVYLYFRHDRIR